MNPNPDRLLSSDEEREMILDSWDEDEFELLENEWFEEDLSLRFGDDVSRETERT